MQFTQQNEIQSPQKSGTLKDNENNHEHSIKERGALHITAYKFSVAPASGRLATKSNLIHHLRDHHLRRSQGRRLYDLGRNFYTETASPPQQE